MNYRIIGNYKRGDSFIIEHYYNMGDIVKITEDRGTYANCKRIFPNPGKSQSVSMIHLQKIVGNLNKNIKVL